MVRKHITQTASATAITVAITVASIVGAGAALASTSNNSPRPQNHRKTTAAEREKRYETRLNSAVSNGKLPADKKSAAVVEHTKLMTDFKAAKKLTGDARSTAIRKVWSDAHSWATTNNVNVRYVIGLGHRYESVVTQ